LRQLLRRRCAAAAHTHAHPAPLQCAKLEKVRGTTSSLELSEEFRHLALQVIGEAILSLSPEESDRVFPKLYLPIMARPRPRSRRPAARRLLRASARYEWAAADRCAPQEEANRWSLEPWREFFPSEASKQRRRVEELNEYILGACAGLAAAPPYSAATHAPSRPHKQRMPARVASPSASRAGRLCVLAADGASAVASAVRQG
jgi:hypothetical protein